MASSYIAWYMFLAGVGSGAFFVGAAVDFVLRVRRAPWFAAVSPVTDFGLIAGPAVVALGALFLVLDLGAPENALNIFLYPSGSILSIGAWSILVFCLCALAAFVLGRFEGSRIVRAAETLFQVVAAVASVFVMAYAGLYFASFPSVPFLHTPWLVLLFVASALATGVAFLMLAGIVRQEAEGVAGALRRIAPFDIALVCLEGLMLVGFIADAFSGGAITEKSAASLFGGDLSAVFWIGVVALGLIVPLLGDIHHVRYGRLGVAATGALCALAGGLLLRFAVLLAAVRFNMVDMSVQLFWM